MASRVIAIAATASEKYRKRSTARRSNLGSSTDMSRSSRCDRGLSGESAGAPRTREWSGRDAGQVESDYAGQYQSDRHQLERRHRLAQDHHAHHRCPGRADAGPDRVRRADLEPGQGLAQQPETDERAQGEADCGPEPGEIGALLQQHGERRLEQAGHDNHEPCHGATSSINPGGACGLRRVLSALAARDSQPPLVIGPGPAGSTAPLHQPPSGLDATGHRQGEPQREQQPLPGRIVKCLSPEVPEQGRIERPDDGRRGVIQGEALPREGGGTRSERDRGPAAGNETGYNYELAPPLGKLTLGPPDALLTLRAAQEALLNAAPVTAADQVREVVARECAGRGGDDN